MKRGSSGPYRGRGHGRPQATVHGEDTQPNESISQRGANAPPILKTVKLLPADRGKKSQNGYRGQSRQRGRSQKHSREIHTQQLSMQTSRDSFLPQPPSNSFSWTINPAVGTSMMAVPMYNSFAPAKHTHNTPVHSWPPPQFPQPHDDFVLPNYPVYNNSGAFYGTGSNAYPVGSHSAHGSELNSSSMPQNQHPAKRRKLAVETLAQGHEQSKYPSPPATTGPSSLPPENTSLLAVHVKPERENTPPLTTPLRPKPEPLPSPSVTFSPKPTDAVPKLEEPLSPTLSIAPKPTMSGSKFYPGLAKTLQSGHWNCSGNRKAWIKNMRMELKGRVHPERVFFRQDGISVDWTSKVPLMPDTLLPPLAFSQNISIEDDEDEIQIIDPPPAPLSLPPKPVTPPASVRLKTLGVVSPNPPPIVEPAIVSITAPAKATTPAPPTPVALIHSNPAPPEPLLHHELSNTPPVLVKAISNRAKRVQPESQPLKPLPKPARNIQEVSYIDTPPVETAINVAQLEEDAEDFLRKYVLAFDKDRSSLASAYSRLATLSCKIHQTTRANPHHSSGSIAALFSTLECGHREGRLDISSALVSIDARFKFFPPKKQQLSLEFDEIYLGKSCGIFLAAYAELVSSDDRVGLDMSFMLRETEDDEEDRLNGGLWTPMVVVNQQMTFRDLRTFYY